MVYMYENDQRDKDSTTYQYSVRTVVEDCCHALPFVFELVPVPRTAEIVGSVDGTLQLTFPFSIEIEATC